MIPGSPTSCLLVGVFPICLPVSTVYMNYSWWQGKYAVALQQQEGKINHPPPAPSVTIDLPVTMLRLKSHRAVCVNDKEFALNRTMLPLMTDKFSICGCTPLGRQLSFMAMMVISTKLLTFCANTVSGEHGFNRRLPQEGESWALKWPSRAELLRG